MNKGQVGATKNNKNYLIMAKGSALKSLSSNYDQTIPLNSFTF